MSDVKTFKRREGVPSGGVVRAEASGLAGFSDFCPQMRMKRPMQHMGAHTMNQARRVISKCLLAIVSVVIALGVAAWPLQKSRAAVLGDFTDHGEHGNRHWKHGDEDDQDQDTDRDEGEDEDHDWNRYRRRGFYAPVFGARERDIIRAYFGDGYSSLPPGLAKRGGNLPPGLEKHLERNGQLPPGLQKRLSPLPVGLERRLPPLPTIYRRGTIGPDVVIMNTRTGRIIDIMRGVANR